jgi:hypothetical protein
MNAQAVTGEMAGQEAYRAYGDVVGWQNYQGLPMPSWENLTPKIREAWVAAAAAAHAFTDRAEKGERQ